MIEFEFKVGKAFLNTNTRPITILKKYYKKFKPLADVEIKKIVEGEKILVIVTKQGDAPRIVGKKGVMAKK